MNLTKSALDSYWATMPAGKSTNTPERHAVQGAVGVYTLSVLHQKAVGHSRCPSTATFESMAQQWLLSAKCWKCLQTPVDTCEHTNRVAVELVRKKED